jgi:hypothetical protein
MKPTKITSITTKAMKTMKKKQAGRSKVVTERSQPKQPPQRKPITAPLPSFIGKKYLSDEQVGIYTGIPKRKLAFWRSYGIHDGPPYKRFRGQPLYEVHALERWIDGLPAGGDPTFHVRWTLETLSGLPLETLASTAKQIAARDADSLSLAIKARAMLDALIVELEKAKP